MRPGTLLASATFSGETASGWQEVQFATPVAITANTTYVASYYTPSGFYSVTRPYFTSQVSSPPLRAPYKSMVVFSTRHSASVVPAARGTRPAAATTTRRTRHHGFVLESAVFFSALDRLTFSYGLQRLGPGAFIGA